MLSEDSKKIKIKEIIFLIAILGTFGIFFPIYGDKETTPEEAFNPSNSIFTTSQDTLIAFSNPSEPSIKVIKRVKMIITGYSSSPDETDSTPFITASGERVRVGICANNLLPLHTKIRIPELFGDRIFTIKDRMNSNKSPYHIDIWFPTKKEALEFGAKFSYVEILSIK